MSQVNQIGGGGGGLILVFWICFVSSVSLFAVSLFRNFFSVSIRTSCLIGSGVSVICC